jgi:hypothetical protein
MSFPRCVFWLLAAGLPWSGTLRGQTSTTTFVNNEFVVKEFGSTCALVGMPPIEGDFNGDGIADIVIPARCTSPLMNQAENQYRVIDPYDAFFGYGNPKLTTQFATEDLDHRAFSLLVIHGAGAQAWRSPTPMAKFMIVNIPFKQVYVKKLSVKRRKPRTAIYLEETGESGMASVIFWDGRKYRYEPMGSDME